MAKERLSKLQKWIIKTCYERSQDGFMVSRKELSGVYLEDTNKIVKEASLSRSLWLLLENEPEYPYFLLDQCQTISYP